MQKILLVIALGCCLTSCFVFGRYSKRDFVYNDGGQQVMVPLTVPKGYSKQERIDTAGIQMTMFYYPSGELLYTAYVTDTNTILQPIPKPSHQPLEHRLGGQIFKGQDSTFLFYREIRMGRFRAGYRFVPREREGDFDEATNLISLGKRKD